jgi:Secretion system C-terminal sorting domain
MTDPESTFVNNVASLCPLVDGTIVYVAKEILGEEALLTDNANCTDATPRSNERAINTNIDISLYPNPANSLISIVAPQIISSASIFTMDGKMVKSIINTSDIDIADLSNGMYFLNICLEDGSKSVMKFIKE